MSMRMICSIVISIMVAAVCYFYKKIEDGWGGKNQKYVDYGEVYTIYHCFYWTLLIFVYRHPYCTWEERWQKFLSWGIGSLVQGSLFFFVLLLVIPLLRKYISAKACAHLWFFPMILIVSAEPFMAVTNPLLVLTVPNGFEKIILYVWFVGFLVVFGWYMVSHFLFYHSILKDALPGASPEMVNMWRDACNKAKIVGLIELILSPKVKTPLSIGMFRKNIKIVLPVREYSPEQLQLIFRHELIHINQRDSWKKFWLMLYTACFWFNPLMWVAMKKSADDFELSCDEIVLRDMSEENRRLYAELLLQTVETHRGFTTCLSASASALRYRMRNIMKPRKRSYGSWVIGGVMFVLLMTSGYITCSYETVTGEALLEQEERSVLTYVTFQAENQRKQHFTGLVREKEIQDEVVAYLSQLEFRPLRGNYTFSNFEYDVFFSFGDSNNPNGIFNRKSIEFDKRFVRVVGFTHEFNQDMSYYYLASDVDWEYLYSLLKDL